MNLLMMGVLKCAFADVRVLKCAFTDDGVLKCAFADYSSEMWF